MKTPFPKFDEALVREIETYLDQDYQTEIDRVENGDIEEGDGIDVLIPLGRRKHPGSVYVRPMIQILPHDYSGYLHTYCNPCPDCDDWSRTSDCAVHYEAGLDRAINGRVDTARSSPSHRNADTAGDLIAESIRQVQERLDRPLRPPVGGNRAVNAGFFRRFGSEAVEAERMRQRNLRVTPFDTPAPLQPADIHLTPEEHARATFTLHVGGQTLQGVDSFEIEVTSGAGGPLEVDRNEYPFS